MYASIRTYDIKPGTAEEFLRRVQQGFVPLIRQVSDFRAYSVLQVGDEEVISVSLFDSPAGAQESVRRAADWVAKNISSFIQGQPEIAVGHVRIVQLEREQAGKSGCGNGCRQLTTPSRRDNEDRPFS